MKPKYTIALATASVAIFLDQLTKWWINSKLAVGEMKVLIPDFLSFHHLVNPGAAFGLFRDLPDNLRTIFFLCVGALAMGMIFFYLKSAEDDKRFFPLALGLVLGGALGNIIDRVRIGHVTDFVLVEATFLGETVVRFMDSHLTGHYWPNFNVADSAIVVGIIGMAIDLLIFTKDGEDGEAAESGASTDQAG